MEQIVNFFFGAFVFIVATGIAMGLRDDGWDHSPNGSVRVDYWAIPIAAIVLLLIVPAVYAWWIGS